MTPVVQGEAYPTPLAPALKDFQRRWLKILFGILLVALSAIWMLEAGARHELNLIDQIAYPVILTTTSLSQILLRWWPQRYTLAVVGTVGVTTLYMTVFLQAIVWGYIPITDNYTLATFAQWFPLAYIILFLFLKKNQALAASICIYGSLLISVLIKLYLERSLPWAEQTFPYFVHMLMSHLIYIAVFVAVATLQMSFVAARLEAKKANIDPLTGLANRRAALRTLDQAIAQASSDNPWAVILIDIDCFKSINDTFGHSVGDSVLVRVAALLRQELRQTDLASRWGGEEFLVVLGPRDPAEAVPIADRLRLRLAAHPHPEVGQVTASLGVAIATNADETLDALVSRADAALYQAKREGRNRVVGSTSGSASIASTRG